MPNASPHTCLQKALDHLVEQDQDGSFSYHPGQPAAIEATAWCSIALRDRGQLAERTRSFLLGCQNKDGGWSTRPQSGPSDWTTSLALLALRLLAPESLTSPPFDRGVAFLMSTRAELYNLAGRLVLWLSQGPKAAGDARGWTWNPGCFHWVEPTSYAVLAIDPLACAGRADVKEAIDSARKLILTHECDGGGWNYGNSISLGAHLPPYPVTTAQALLALQDQPANPIVVAGLRYLRRTARVENTVMSLAWAALAADALGQAPAPELSQLTALQKPDGSFSSSLHLTGLAACALETAAGSNPLKLSEPASANQQVKRR